MAFIFPISRSTLNLHIITLTKYSKLRGAAMGVSVLSHDRVQYRNVKGGAICISVSKICGTEQIRTDKLQIIFILENITAQLKFFIIPGDQYFSQIQ
jgi:hypothetical protein